LRAVNNSRTNTPVLQLPSNNNYCYRTGEPVRNGDVVLYPYNSTQRWIVIKGNGGKIGKTQVKIQNEISRRIRYPCINSVRLIAPLIIPIPIPIPTPNTLPIPPTLAVGKNVTAPNHTLTRLPLIPVVSNGAAPNPIPLRPPVMSVIKNVAAPNPIPLRPPVMPVVKNVAARKNK